MPPPHAPPLTRSLYDLGPPEPCPAPFNMADYVMRKSRETPEKTALIVIEGEAGDIAEIWNFAALDHAIRATAAGLVARGLEPGDRVALRMGNISDFPILFFGTIAAGGIAVPTSAQLTEPEFTALLADMTPRFVAMSEDLSVTQLPAGASPLHPAEWRGLRDTPPMDPVESAPDDPAFLIYTSGTSGGAKGVLHAQRSAWARRMMWADWYGLGPDDVMLHAGAFNWTYTLGTGLTDPWAAGATAVIHTGPASAEALPRIAERHDATILAAVPGIYRRILRTEHPLARSFSALRHALVSGERMPETLAEAWRARTQKPIYEALGMSEVSTYLSSGPNCTPRPGAIGRPQTGRRVAILDGAEPAPVDAEGALAVSTRDPGLMLRYWNRPDETAAARRGEWFLTGDRAAMDADGYVTFLGRSDDVMTAQGYRVSAQEVEDVLLTHPGIAEAGVTEVRLRDDLTLIAAFVVPDGPWPGEEALRAFSATRLAAYKCPRLWQECDALPRTANGKLLRRKLAQDFDPSGVAGPRQQPRQGPA
ncbi:MAG: AMP-binding protein [Pseudomonadota bacterium]